MKFENTWTGNWKNAFHGLRHPMESYDKSDSKFGITCFPMEEEQVIRRFVNIYETIVIGPNDMDLAQRMIKAGNPNDKYLRQIFVSVDITAPEYFWSQVDTYKIGTTANSTSKMHKLASTPITIDCFEMGDYSPIGRANNKSWELVIGICEDLRQAYNETKDIRYWKELIRILPESWLQTRAWSANYEVLRNIIHWRRNHKLKYEWDSFIDCCKTLPYAEELLFYNQ